MANKNDSSTQNTVETVLNESKKKASKKNKRPQIGGTAVTGAKSTQPKQGSGSNNPQQQEYEMSNRLMRRRMQQMGAGPSAEPAKPVKTLHERRKEKIERIKEKRKEQLAAAKRALPSGKISTDTSRATRMMIFVAIGVALLIGVFVLLRVFNII